MILPVPPIPPVGKILSRPYEGEIGNFQEKKASIDRISTLIHEVNPDYLLFHPIINSIQNLVLLASYASLWLLGQFFFLIYAMFNSVIKEGVLIYYLYAIICLIFILISFFTAPFLTLKQLKTKKSRYHKILLLKNTQQIAYYEHNRKQAPIFHLINYKYITASVRRNEGLVYEVLNLHVIDESTREPSLSINFEDMQLNPYDQWAFIRTYMERPAEELPLDPRYAHACPTDISTLLFACADIAQEKKNKGLTGLRHEVTFMGWLRACTVSYLDLAEGNIYQSSANPALHPEVQRRLMWDGQNNPYNILPVTAERQAAFANQNQAVKRKWYSGMAINATWFIGSILYVMLVIA
ncbi:MULTISPECIES: hypothetical protein [unclassified Psychrobacter]|uniref:hypothetical protein n=1 Tax=unclassified Psychrobacter TaxID=196806 RepID=UPI000EE4307E|nr:MULTISPECIES: hypothetical protein [unclassified Psychrobacter]MBE8608589.1 hypothetical protein [Pseudomonas lundensis]HCI75240.1 hypothetical protein [Psychrobacter sp.]